MSVESEKKTMSFKKWRALRELGEKTIERVMFEHNKVVRTDPLLGAVRVPFENVDFRSVPCYAAPFGGPIAVGSYNSKNFVQLEDSIVPTIELYTACGIKLGVINVSEFHKNIVQIGWNDEEDLVIIKKDATISTYTVLGELKKTMEVPIIKKEGIAQAKIWGTGFALFTQKDRTFYPFVDNNLHKYAADAIAKDFCWTYVEAELSNSTSPEEKRFVEIIVGLPESIIVLGLNSAFHRVNTNKGPFLKMTVSPSGKILACYTHRHEVWLVQTDFAKEFVLFVTSAPREPDQFEWCGETAIACYWRQDHQNVLLLISPTGEYTKYVDSEPAHISSECDGLRIFSRKGCEFIYLVGNEFFRIFNITEDQEQVQNPAKLYRAAHLFKEEKISVEDIIRDIKKSLPQTIELIAEAAVNEFDVDVQEDLLNVAAFGIGFLDKRSSCIEIFKETVKTLRVLNAMRDVNIGIPLSYIQYRILTPHFLIDRLISRNLHMLAFEICQYLGLKTDKVLSRWAKKQVLAQQYHGKADEEIASAIRYRLHGATGVSFASIAYEAYKAGKEELATLLLDAEPVAGDQVPLLVHMRKYEFALDKAIKSGDTNLIHLVLSVYHDDTEHGMGNVIDFENILRRLTPARAIWTSVCQETNPDYLLKMYGKEKMAMEIVRIYLQKGYSNPEELPEKLKEAGNVLKKSPYSIEAKLTEQELSLHLVQKELESSLGGTFVGSSLTNTLYRCILMGAGKRAKKIRVDFEVPNKRWWWIKISALAETGRWEALRAFGDPIKHKSPIGYKPFAEVCFQNGNTSEAMYYLKFMPDDETKVMFYVQLQCWKEAIQTAESLDFPEVIFEKILSKAKDPSTRKKIEDLIEKQSNQQ